jgi:UDP-N-acetylglucosamine--N-acetylmuramyl-(pentapeptide) pyrophosphoryl-undecaprenol N-acetylglucosamine transferase
MKPLIPNFALQLIARRFVAHKKKNAKFAFGCPAGTRLTPHVSTSSRHAALRADFTWPSRSLANEKSGLKIVLATGGSGGHIFPALVTAQQLKSRGHEIIFAGSFKHSGAKIQSAGFKYFEIHAKGFSMRSPLAVFQFILAAAQSFFESQHILRQIKPQIVVGFGGYGAFTIVLAAFLQRIPTMIQEQNVVPGKANRLLSFVARRIAVGFKEAQSRFPASKVLVTGCPARALPAVIDRNGAFENFGFAQGLKIIFVLGGSQGSRRINAEFIKAAERLKAKMNFGVIHLCGANDVELCKAAYQRLGIAHWVASFTDEIFKAYAIADLVVSRSGAMTVTELAAFCLPAILIPYPYAGGHQRENALVLTKTKASCLIDEKDLTTDVLEKALSQMLTNPIPKEQIKIAYEGIYRPDAAFVLADEIERLKA